MGWRLNGTASCMGIGLRPYIWVVLGAIGSPVQPIVPAVPPTGLPLQNIPIGPSVLPVGPLVLAIGQQCISIGPPMLPIESTVHSSTATCATRRAQC